MTIFLISINIILNVFSLKKLLHIFQLKDYNFSRYIHYFGLKYTLILILNLASFLSVKLFNIDLITTLIYITNILINSLYFLHLIRNNKTPLKYTQKVIRLYIISSLLLILLNLGHCGILTSNLLILIIPPLSLFINIYDKIKNKYYISQAIKKLEENTVKIIAITGSNGKTSVKDILYKLLSTKYNILKTPKSYNTPLGIASFINNSDIKSCNYLILEYGARRKGDIKKLCKLFGADYGIITTISSQHLETFKTIENILQTKNELSKFLNNKLCIFNADNIHTIRMYTQKNNLKNLVSTYFDTDICAKNIKLVNFTTHFTLVVNNQEFEAQTKLLGRHNVLNICLATSLAIHLGISPQEITNTISSLTATPHRLEYLKSHINILDDSYNCSILSAKESIRVLESTHGKKMIVTPGIIECGKSQYKINYKLGQLCQNVDYLIIVGEHNKHSIRDGYLSQTNKSILYAKNLEECKKYFSLLSRDDTLLLLNDLPDDYK